MSNTEELKYLVRGLSQQDRYLPYLNPNNIKIDGRSEEDLLNFIENYATLINYYNYNQLTGDIIKEGDWSFFVKHPIFYMARIAGLSDVFFRDEIDTVADTIGKIITSEALQIKASTAHGTNSKITFYSKNISEMVYALRVLFDIITKIFFDFNKWLSELEVFPENFQNGFISLVNSKLKRNVFQTIGYAKFFSKNINSTNYIYLNKNFFDDFNSSLWGNIKENAPYYEKNLQTIYDNYILKYPSLEESNYRFITENYGFLTEIVNDLLVARNHLKLLAKRNIKNLLDGKGDLRPDLALVIAFTKLFQNAQYSLNNLTSKHLNFYYNTILNFKLKEQQPDSTTLLLTLTSNTNSFLLPKNTLFNGGEDSGGKLIAFETLNDIILNQAQITTVLSLHVASNPLLIPKKNETSPFITGIYGQDYTYPDQNIAKPFKLFGEDQLMLATDQKTMQSKNPGFAIASEIFYLTSGVYSLTLIFSLTKESFQSSFIPTFIQTLNEQPKNNSELLEKLNNYFAGEFLNDVNIMGTGNNGWVTINCESVTLSSIETPVLIFKLHQSATTNPIIGFNSFKHKDNIQTTLPVIKILFENNSKYYSYNFFNKVVVSSIDIELQVNDFRNVSLANQLGTIKATKPFAPLGSQPNKGNYLIIGGNELNVKGVDELSLNVKWDNLIGITSFDNYYQNYSSLKPITNESFKVKLYSLNSQNWVSPENNQEYNLFQTNINSETEVAELDKFSLITFPTQNGKIIPKKQPYNDNLMAEYDTSSTSGFIKLELSDPEFGFGASIYSDSMSSIVLDNAKARMSPLVPDILNVTKGLEGLQTTIKKLPNVPFTPIAEYVSVNYKSSTRIDLIQNHDEASFFHIGFFNEYPALSKNNPTTTSGGVNIIPSSNGNKTFYLGFDHVNIPETVSVFLKITSGFIQQTGTKASNINWQYYSSAGWKPLTTGLNINDTTNGLINSGIVFIDIPVDASMNPPELRQSKIWVKAESENGNESICESINTQAVQVVFSNPSEVTRTNMTLPAFSIKKLVTPIADIAKITQPYDSINGIQKEEINQLYTRVSELLRHKNRAILPIDYERIILQQFPNLFRVKYISNTADPLKTNPNLRKQIQIVVLNHENQKFTPPKYLTLDELENVKMTIANIAPNGCFINVFNVVYEHVAIKCKIKFVTEDSFYLKKLTEDIKSYFSIYNFAKNKNVIIGGNIHKNDLLTFIQNLEYVVYITSFSIIKTCFFENQFLFYDSADETQNGPTESFTPYSIFVPASHHYIEIIETESYQYPEVTGLDDLIIGENLIL